MAPALRPFAVTGLLLGLAIGPAAAQDTPDAVGRLSYGGESPRPGAAICSGTLVAPDLVLTADHCLRPALDDPQSVYFSAALVDGKARAVRRGAAITLAHPGPDLPSVPDDLGLLQLDQPFAPEEATPLTLADAGLGRLTLVAYARSEPDTQIRRDDCFRVATMGTVMGLTCTVVSGNSGAPVLFWDSGTWHVVAVVVASGQGLLQAYAAVPPARLTGQHIN